jgi:hexosaminidase
MSYKHLQTNPCQSFNLHVQANLWTEFIADVETAEYMLLPRLSAIAECLWSPLAQRSWQPFVRRAELMLDRCHRAGYICRPMYDVSRA